MHAHLATVALEAVGKRLWGFKPNLMRHIVEQRGAFYALIWFVTNMPKYEYILRVWGPIRTHLVSTTISTLNGCPYCTHGHAYAFQLHYLRQYGKLFALDEAAILQLHSLGEGEVLIQLEQALIEAGLAEEIPYLQRIIELRHDVALSNTREDGHLLHLMRMFAVLNECGINGQPEIDAAHDPINKDAALRKRYAALRMELKA